MSLKDKISATISEIDPEGLIILGAPIDEYEYESKLIEKSINNNDFNFQSFIDIFEFSFGSDVVNIRNHIKMSRYKKAYKEVLKIINIHFNK